MSRAGSIGIVLIGRNEGQRLIRALAAIPPGVTRRVYVDSGSTDGSIEAAQAAGAEVICLDTAHPFTAARARNAGIQALMADGSVDLIQFIDGDCELQPGWIAAAQAFLEDHPETAVVCGRRRERHPDATLWNRLVDAEWDTPVGEARACGGDAMMRAAPLIAAGGYNPDLIAGEEPELCIRLRAAGWKVWRLDAEMTLHDAAMTRFGQWWQRARRAGHAYAEGAAMHGFGPERHKLRETRSAMVWGFALPLAALAGAVLISPWALALLLLYPLQVLRLIRKGHDPMRAIFLVLAKLPEVQGVLTYLWRRASGARGRLIEYK
ncbi:glycosyltransferase family 2 protein [Rhodovulum visakhapatnamense]|uniref:GT2 family glycosyltransferase n=1 Tax=Rhodovulum visakhapatnamense TaxID=364297 RepID=A0A4V3GS77_9RHOB|nr:glycosyltransferase [Rhodovulum visakhapatnamense]TDX21873.1 GT2 family glycosyltransferase [Rhodovulum visakhapatnamense]